MLCGSDHVCELLHCLVDFGIIVGLQKVTSALDPFADVRIPVVPGGCLLDLESQTSGGRLIDGGRTYQKSQVPMGQTVGGSSYEGCHLSLKAS